MHRSLSVSHLLVSSLLIGLVACGGGETSGETGGGSGGSGGSKPGFTACGDYPDNQPKTCQPGQYCSDEKFSDCSTGCLSNVNCASDQTCVKAAGQDEGTCQNNSTSTTSTGMTTDQLARCKAACTKLLQCSLIDAGEGAQCDNECNGLSESQQKAFADCVDPWTCASAIPGCLNMQCGPSYPCADASQSCVGHSCL